MITDDPGPACSASFGVGVDACGGLFYSKPLIDMLISIIDIGTGLHPLRGRWQAGSRAQWG
jgi:hypothetical protein